MAGTPPKSYPRLTAKVWWALRDEFRRSMPKTVDVPYLASKLGLKDTTAGNLPPSLRGLGLIDETGKPTSLANQWRDDEGYRDACGQILARAFPDVLDNFPPPDPDRTQLERWFAQTTGAGAGAASQMAAFYRMVAMADPSVRSEKPDRTNGAPKKTHSRVRAAKPMNGTSATASATIPTPAMSSDGRGTQPAVHIDIQIHIDANASADQIDQIFASMARHLYNRQAS